jgi:hypothetical protein
MNGSDSRSRLRGLVQASDTSRAIGQFDRPGFLGVIGISSSGSTSSGGSSSGGTPGNHAQVEIGGPSKLSKRRDDAGRPGFFSKLLGKNKNQGGANDEAFERSAYPFFGFCIIADNLALNSYAFPR